MIPGVVSPEDKVVRLLYVCLISLCVNFEPNRALGSAVCEPLLQLSEQSYANVLKDLSHLWERVSALKLLGSENTSAGLLENQFLLKFDELVSLAPKNSFEVRKDLYSL